MPKTKPWVFDVNECLEHLSVMVSIVKALEKKHGLPPGLVKCRASAERYLDAVDQHLSNWSGT